MTVEFVVHLVRQNLMTAFWVCLPILVLGFAVGVVVSLVQVLTSMQDAAFGSVPRLFAFLVGLLIFLPWMLMRLMTYTTALFGDLSRFAR
ncbi:MAG: flagellar biosynthetic protein FliQ [Bryobacterales bacterium]|jgi:flagellar biosynthesis protein FliQ|nr:flagellar biosynthetic protein FliQ [Bryobacterales bacterium]